MDDIGTGVSYNMTNLQLLLDRYNGLTLDTDQIMDVLKINNRNTFHNMVSAGKVPFHTFRAGRKRIAKVKDVAAWMDTV